MNSIKTYMSKSKQFKDVATRLFKNNYKLDHYATRSFFIYPILNYWETKNYKLEQEEFYIKENVNSRWMSNNQKFTNPITNKLERKDFPYIFLTNVNIVPLDALLPCQMEEHDELMNYVNNPRQLPYQYYLNLQKENHILAWTLLFENHINHLAFQVEDIDKCLNEVKTKLPEYKINNIQNPIEISSDGNLKQFSLKAENTSFHFADQIRQVPYTFVEFVERSNGRRGFETKNAQGIFESTNK